MNRREAGTMLLGALTLGVTGAAVAQDYPRGPDPRNGDQDGRGQDRRYGDPDGRGPDPRYGGPGGPGGDPERRAAFETLRIGSLALQTSQLAQSRARGYRVREFADFEVAEQTTIAQIIRESTGLTPPPPDPMARDVMARLQNARGADFERAYVAAQIDGHQKLLAVQDRYLSVGRDPGMRHVAMLARGQINEHLRLLSDIRDGRGA